MRWTFGFSSKKGNSKQDEAGPSTAIVPARHSTAGPSRARPPRPSSVAVDAIAGLPIPAQSSSSVASAHSSERRRRRRSNPTTSAEESSAPETAAQEVAPHSSPMISSPAEPAEPNVPPEPHVPPEENEPAPAEPYVAPGAVPAPSDSFHWEYSIPVLTPEHSRGTNAAHIDEGLAEQFFGREFLSPYHSQLSDGHTRVQPEAGTGHVETATGLPTPRDSAPAHYYNEGYYPMERTTYHPEPVVFNGDGYCVSCACFGGHFAWCNYRHVPLPLPLDYRCPRCGQGGHLDNACPAILQPAEPVQQTPPPPPPQPVTQPTPTPSRRESTRPSPPTSTDSGQLRGSHCHTCGAHRRYWYRNLASK